MKYLTLCFMGCLLVLTTRCVSIASTPSDVVREYCELDARGARVFPEKYNDIRKLMAWEDDQDEPGWDCFKIIDNYKLTTVDITEINATIDVEYSVVAMLCSDDILEKEKQKEVTRFNLVRQEGRWKIKEYVVYPRVYKSSIIKILEQRVEFLATTNAEHDKARNIAKYIQSQE